MYKNLEILDKQKHKDIKFDNQDSIEIAKKIGFVPVGVAEILDMSCFAPVIITADDKAEFAAFTGISEEVNIYSKEAYVPRFVKSYPFLNVTAKDENDNLNEVIGIDNADFTGEDKEVSIFNEDGELNEIANEKIENVRELNRQRAISKRIIEQLKENDLLLKRDFKVKVNDEERTLLNEFYIVDREKLLKLDDETIASWARKGWMSLIDAHIKSLGNFKKALKLS